MLVGLSNRDFKWKVINNKRHFRRHIFIALLHEACITVLNIITPAHQAHKSFVKPSQLPGEYTAQLLPFRRIGLIKHNFALTGTHLLLGGEKQLW